MFGSLKKAWRGARGVELRKEVEQVLAQTASFSPTTAYEFSMGYLGGWALVIKHHGDPKNLSYELRKKLAKDFQARAKASYHHNVGRANGIFLVSAGLEAMSLPGEDAETVVAYVEAFAPLAEKAVMDADGALPDSSAVLAGELR